MFKIAVICGGPSLERGISLNSARSILDHLPNKDVEIHPLYVDYEKNFYAILPAQLYSNTPADFDFKLEKMATKLDKEALKHFFQQIDIVFPVIHGPFGEDGELQTLLEELSVPFVGPNSASCKKMFQKHKAFEILRKNGFQTLPTLVLHKDQADMQTLLSDFFKHNSITRAVVKPSSGGSSIGVSSVSSKEEAHEKAMSLFARGIDTYAIVEPFCMGSEFTVVVFENSTGEPVALIPTEIETSYEDHQIFDYRKKYLPTNNTAYHTPPRYDDSVIKQICSEAEQLFSLFQMNDFVRMDGWVMPDNTIYFTDLNPISGLEQNSFLFRQASVVGLTHQQAIHYIVKHACGRYGFSFPEIIPHETNSKNPVYVLFGGNNAERQVSLMSGTNVWLKLMKSGIFNPTPMLYDQNGNIWKLPYSYTMNHTVEEIYSNCLNAGDLAAKTEALTHSIQRRLAIPELNQSLPEQMTMDQFLAAAKKASAFVFIAMHGGEGEDGTLQNLLENYELVYNGSDSKASARCMDKYLTGQIIKEINHPDILSLAKKTICIAETQKYSSIHYVQLWDSICREVGSNQLIIKPRSDGCSAGIVLLQTAHDFERYCKFIHNKSTSLPPNSFAKQSGPIEMPSDFAGEYLLESYIETDSITINNLELLHKPSQGWIELTVGVLEQNHNYCALNPSIAVSEGAVLSLEEKFQGGTGINITPPPESVISRQAVEKIKSLIEKTAEILSIQNYARIDIFFNRITEKMIVIEANTLPALTPSTVIYHQALAEKVPMAPLDFLEKIISSAAPKVARKHEVVMS